MWLASLLIVMLVAFSSIVVIRSRQSADVVRLAYDDQAARTGSSVLDLHEVFGNAEIAPDDFDEVSSEHFESIEHPFELPTYDPDGADNDGDPKNVYATVSRMRDPKNWGRNV